MPGRPSCRRRPGPFRPDRSDWRLARQPEQQQGIGRAEHAWLATFVRDLMAFCATIVMPMKPFLARKGHPLEVLNRTYDVWWKSMILQATLWMQPYIRDGDF